MKKLITITFAILLTGFFAIQAQGQIKVGAHLGYSTDISNVGFGIDGVYSINEKFDIAADLDFYPKKDFVSWTAVNANVHYNFVSSETGPAFYALGGLQMLFATVKIDMGYLGTVEDTNSDFGLNLGGGTCYPVSDKISIFGEAKITIINGSYFNIRGGALYNL